MRNGNSDPTITELRRELFDTLKALRDKDNPMDLERAKAISGVAQTIINSAKVECDYLRATEQSQGTGFIRDDPRPARRLPPGTS